MRTLREGERWRALHYPLLRSGRVGRADHPARRRAATRTPASHGIDATPTTRGETMGRVPAHKYAHCLFQTCERGTKISCDLPRYGTHTHNTQVSQESERCQWHVHTNLRPFFSVSKQGKLLLPALGPWT